MKYLMLMMGTAALAVVLALPADAAPIKMEPGLWTISVTMKMAHHPRLETQSSFKRCIKPVDSEKDNVTPALETRPGMSCTVKSFKRQGNTATYTRVCTGTQGTTTSDGTMTFNSPTSYDAKVTTTGNIRGRQIKTTRTVHAERVGTCSD